MTIAEQTQKRSIGAASPDAPNANAQGERDHSAGPNGAQALPLSHPLARKVVEDYMAALHLDRLLDARPALGVYLPNLGSFEGSWDELMAALEAYARRKQSSRAGRKRSGNGNGHDGEPPRLTKTEFRALYAARQDSVRAPGCWTPVRRHEGVTTRTLNKLASRGLLARKQVNTGYYTARSGRRRSKYTHYAWLYRITARGARLLRPELPPPVLEPHRIRPLHDLDRPYIHNMLRDLSDVPGAVSVTARRCIRFCGNHVVYMQQWTPGDRPDADYPAALLLDDVVAYIRLHWPRAVIDRARLFPARVKRPPQPTAEDLQSSKGWTFRKPARPGMGPFLRHTWIGVVFRGADPAAAARPPGRGAAPRAPTGDAHRHLPGRVCPRPG